MEVLSSKEVPEITTTTTASRRRTSTHQNYSASLETSLLPDQSTPSPLEDTESTRSIEQESYTQFTSSPPTLNSPTKLPITTSTKINEVISSEVEGVSTGLSGYDTVDTFSPRQWPTSTSLGVQFWFTSNSTENSPSTLSPSESYSWKSVAISSAHWLKSSLPSVNTSARVDCYTSRTSSSPPVNTSSSKLGPATTVTNSPSDQKIYSTTENENYSAVDSSLTTREVHLSTQAPSSNEARAGTVSHASSDKVSTTVTKIWTDHPDLTTSYTDHCKEPCPSNYEEGPEYCYRILPAKESSTYKRALKNCQNESDSDLADEIDLRNPEVIQVVRMASQLLTPTAALFYVNEHESKTIKENKTVRVISMRRTTRFFLDVNATAGMNDRFSGVHGVCKRTKHCAKMQCNLDDFVFYGTDKELVLPEINLKMDIGQKLSVPCAQPNNTKTVEVTCNDRGALQPHPTAVNCTMNGSDDIESGEMETVWNRKVLKSCDECHRLGTSSCNQVDGGFECTCKPNWSGFICWKSPDQCELDQLFCGSNGTCVSEVDQAYCLCDEGYGGDHCEVSKSTLSLNAHNESSLISAATGSALIMTTNEIILMVLKGIILLHRPKSGEDTQTFYQNMRSLALSVAGLLVLFFHHPAIFVITPFDCSIWFHMITICYSLALGFFVLEALNAYEVSNMEQRNIWGDAMEKTGFDIPKLALRTLLTVVAIGGAVTAVTAAHFGHTATSWSCLGNFAERTTDLWLPIVLINACAALAATSFSYCGWFTLRNVPQYRQKMSIYLAERVLSEKCCIDKCYRNVPLTAFGPWLLYGTWLTLAVSSDWVADSALNK
ncbi:hypothetical protein Aduo_013241 [Ancylostoma duodenale]